MFRVERWAERGKEGSESCRMESSEVKSPGDRRAVCQVRLTQKYTHSYSKKLLLRTNASQVALKNVPQLFGGTRGGKR